MYNTFWIGIIVGGVLSLAASICANLLHNRILGVLDNRKLAAQSKRFSKAAEFHTLIEQLHSGDRNKYIYLMRMCVTIIGSFLSAMVMAGAGCVISTISPASLHEVTASLLMQLGLFFLSVSMLYLYQKSTVRFRAIMNSLDEFDRFDAEFREKWHAHLKAP
jgi:hypothetical protein